MITELSLGGAEMMLWKLLSRIDRNRFEPLVIALSSKIDGILDLFMAARVDCRFLGMRSRSDAMVLYRLVCALREFQPDIIQGWMYHGNAAASLASRWVTGRPPVLWNIRGSLNLSQEKRASVLAIRLGAKLAFMPCKIINNSLESALQHEEQLGYESAKRVILPNGFDVEAFRPDQRARAALRSTLGLREDALLIGLMGRYHPMKDHENFLRAAAQLSGQYPEAHFILAGNDVNSSNAILSRLMSAMNLSDRVHLLGCRSDMPAVTAALDIATSASSGGEGFPNVIGEAMSCAVPCVVTDVGASAWVVGDTGKCVVPRDPTAFARAVAALIDLGPGGRKELGRRARDRIVTRFALDAVVTQYEDLYVSVRDEALQLRRAC